MATIPRLVTPDEPAPPSKPKHAQWSDEDVRALLDFLLEHRAQAGDTASFKNSVWQAAAEALGKAPPSKGGPKTANSCQSKWTKVSSILF